MSSRPTPACSVVIATRDRGERIVATLNSVFAGGTEGLEVIVVDQSDGPGTERAIQRFMGRPGFGYLRSATRGCAAGRNVGAARALGELLAFTDDDCLVAPDWLAQIARCFADPGVGLVFGTVEAEAVPDGSAVVTTYAPPGPMLARRLRDKLRVEGIAGCMAVRRSVWKELGGFDELMGVGAAFLAGEETDFTMRALTAGHFVSNCVEARVVHTGSVPASDVPALIGRYWYGTGVAFGKSLRRRPGTTALLLARMAGRWALGRPAVASCLGDRLYRRRRLSAFASGLSAGVSLRIDRGTGRFIE